MDGEFLPTLRSLYPDLPAFSKLEHAVLTDRILSVLLSECGEGLRRDQRFSLLQLARLWAEHANSPKYERSGDSNEIAVANFLSSVIRICPEFDPGVGLSQIAAQSYAPNPLA